MTDKSLQIILNKPIYNNQESIEGKVILINDYPFYLNKIELKLIKQFTCCSGERETKKILFGKQITLFKNNLEFTDIYPGKHTFPFKIQMSKPIKGTTNTSVCFDGICYILKNQFFFEAIIFESQKCLESVKILKEIQFFDNIEVNKPTIYDLEFSHCLCLFYTECRILAVLDKKFYFSGETAKFSLKIQKNERNLKIKSLYVELIQTIFLECENLHEEKVLFKTKGYFDEEIFKAEIKIPFSVPSNVNEDYLKLGNYLKVNVLFERSSLITIRKKINVIKETFEGVELDTSFKFSGKEEPEQVFKF